MKKIFCAIAVLLPLLAFGDSADDPWQPLQFIVGDWAGAGSGKPGEGVGEFSLKPDLNNKVLIRRNHSEYPPKAGQGAGITHDDLMIIYTSPGAQGFRADYFDSEGHVIHYGVSCSENKAVFLSDTPASGMRFRLTYEKKSADELEIAFAMAPPNQDFHPYLKGTVKRK
jgi:hypothetical protein